MKGSLDEISVSDLIKLHCQDPITALLQIVDKTKQADLYFARGRVVHAVLEELQGEEAVYRVMKWDKGSFELIMDKDSPSQSISRSWPSLLLEGARLEDEERSERIGKSAARDVQGKRKTPEALILELSNELNGFKGLTILQNDGRERASYFPQGGKDRASIMAQLLPFLEDVRRPIDRAGIGEFKEELLSSEKGSLLIIALEEGETFLAISVAHTAVERPSIMEQLASIGQKYRLSIEQALSEKNPHLAEHQAQLFVDSEGRVQFASTNLFAITGQRAMREVIGHPLEKSIEADKEEVDHFYPELHEKGVIQKRVMQILGGLGHISLTGVASYDDKGGLLGADIYVSPLKEEDLMSLPLDERSYHEEIPNYVSAQLETLHDYMQNVGGENMSQRMRISLNETAERGGWPIRLSTNAVEVGPDAEIEAYTAIMAKAIIYCKTAVGIRPTAKRISEQGAEFGDQAPSLEKTLGISDLLSRL